MNASTETFRNETRNFVRIVGNDRRMPRAIEVRKKFVGKLRKIVNVPPQFIRKKESCIHGERLKAETENSIYSFDEARNGIISRYRTKIVKIQNPSITKFREVLSNNVAFLLSFTRI